MEWNKCLRLKTVSFLRFWDNKKIDRPRQCTSPLIKMANLQYQHSRCHICNILYLPDAHIFYRAPFNSAFFKHPLNINLIWHSQTENKLSQGHLWISADTSGVADDLSIKTFIDSSVASWRMTNLKHNREPRPAGKCRCEGREMYPMWSCDALIWPSLV